MKATGIKLVFGVVDLKMFEGLPVGAKVRVSMRAGQFATAVVKTSRGVRKGYIEETENGWRLAHCIGLNVKM
jgi:hypothetical protein